MNPFLKQYDGDESDVVLVSRAKDGDKSSLEKLLLKHQPFIYNIAWKMVQRPNDAEDLAQEVNIKIITSLSQFKGGSSFRTWLYRIVVNHFISFQRKSSEKTITGFDDMEKGLDETPNVELSEMEIIENEKLIKEVTYFCMSGMLLCLTREQRIVYILGVMFNADHTIGAEILKISKDNFRQRLSRARKDIGNFMDRKCGLVNESNPCRCYKKVTHSIKGKVISSKNLLFNKEEYASFESSVARPVADELLETLNDKRTALINQLPYKKDFDKKTVLEEILTDKKLKSLLNLN